MKQNTALMVLYIGLILGLALCAQAEEAKTKEEKTL